MAALVVALSLLFLAVKTAGKEESAATLAPEAPQDAPRSPLSKEEIVAVINEATIRHGINRERFLETAKCESGLRPKIVGDDGESYGLWQIHLKSHPTVTMEQAFDPVWSTEWSAVKFKENPKIWTCYRNLYL